MGGPRVIKKYPNRRLYDTVESRYITLADIQRLVIEHVDLAVIDKRSMTDITHSILLQVIADQEQRLPCLLSQKFLRQVICNHGKVEPGALSVHLEEAMRTFETQQASRGTPV
jgi:polyhydroxyalkanoate synthesis repressor PhaR